MAEEVNKQTDEKKTTEVPETEVKKTEPEQKKPPVEYTKVQQKAIDAGWRPRAEFEGADDEFIDAGEFVRRGELFDKIEQRRKEISELRKTVRVMQEHHGKVREAEFKRALDLLKKQKVEALKDNEPERVVDLDTQIDEVKDQLALTKADAAREVIKDEPDPRFLSWVDKNKWYAQNTELKEFADSVGIAYTKAHPGISPVDVLKYVETRVKTAYPDKFKNPNRERASAVEGGDGNRTASRKASQTDDYEMTAEEEKVFATLKRADPKFWTKERYVADLKAIPKR